MIDIVNTDKNTDSTPAWPLCEDYKTEADYLLERGFGDYITEAAEIFSGAEPDVLWLLFLKKEILKTKKVREADIRQIVCTDPLYARIGLMFEQHQNHLMKTRTRRTFGQCGWTPFYGGFQNRVLRLVKKNPKFYVEFDWTRYDGTIPNQVFLRIKQFRFSCLARRFRTPNNRRVYDWYVRNLINRHVLMPSGEVTLQTCGNPSGQVSTTTDNNMVNTWLQAFEFLEVNGLSVEQAQELWEDYDTLIYGDDRLTATPILPDDYVPRVVRLYHDVFGMWVKPEKVRVSVDPFGLSFCGFTIGPGYAPIPTEPKKLLASFNTPLKKLPDVDTLYCKILCFCLLLHNLPDDDPVKVWCSDARFILAQHLRAMGRDPPVHVTRDMLDSLWSGGPKEE
uniref:Non-structural polyprotein 1AB n=1 Tax=Rousettus bat astrovirus TaxID=3141900 RepID=A0AAU7E2F1_9VIRU